MSFTYVYSFLLGTAVLYAFNPSVSNNASFVKVVEKSAPQFEKKERRSLGAEMMRPIKRRRQILFNNRPFKKTYERRRKALQSPMTEVYRVRPVYRRLNIRDRYVESIHYQNDDLVIGIKSELFRLGCFRGKINTLWNAEVREELESLNRGLVTRSAERSTLRYLKRQKTLGCVGNRVWDRLVYGDGVKPLKAMAEVKPQHFEKPKVQKNFSKKQADKKLAQMFVKAKKKKYSSKRRRKRVARKKFGFNGMFGFDAL